MLDVTVPAELIEAFAASHGVSAREGAMLALTSLVRRYTGETCDDFLIEAGPQWRLSWPADPELAPFLAEDLPVMLTGGVFRPSYERHRDLDLAAVHGGADTEFAFAPDATICSAFAAQVASRPSHPAVGTVTYGELGAAVAATAGLLTPARGSRAALLCAHGPNTIVALLAALVSGRAYVPLDPTFPPPRLAHMLADSGADVLITDDAFADMARQLAPDLPIVLIAASGPGTLDTVAQPDDPAYVLYTSGSTGLPKGVVQSHRNVLFGVANHVRNFAITPDDRTSVLTSFGYDMAVTDTYAAILSGATAVPIDIRSQGLDHLAQALRHHGVTIYHSTPTVYRYLIASLGPEGALPSIRAIVLGGEEVTRHDVELARRHFAPNTVFVNGYGTTEISFAAQNHLTSLPAQAVVPIGHPLPGIEIVLVDATDQPVCVSGEVVVRCDHVALGYWNLPELTASRFVDRDGVRSYRTGDLARRRPDGSFIFLGRADRLVKIRGYRVELGEVESRLAALPSVGQAAVIARDSTAGSGPIVKELLGYVVAARGHEADPVSLREALAADLPDFMLPRAIVVLPELPIGPTGKLDVAGLPAPSTSFVEGAFDDLERLIASTWAEVLGVEAVDRHTGFFALGGHSLLLALVQQKLNAALDRDLSLADLFAHPSVAALARHLRAATIPAATLRAADRMNRRRTARR